MLQTPAPGRVLVGFGADGKFTRIHPCLFPARIIAMVEKMDLHDLAGFTLSNDLNVGPLRETPRTGRSCEFNESAAGHHRDTRGNFEHT